VQRPRRTHAGPRSLLRDQRGVVTIEFALLLPVLLAFVFMIIDFARVFNYLNDANQIAANGARFAAVDRNPNGGGSLQEYLRQQADTGELRDGGSSAVADPLDVCIGFPSGSSEVGEPVQVEVRTEFKIARMITQFVPGDPEVKLPITGKATMRIERPPTNYSADC